MKKITQLPIGQDAYEVRRQNPEENVVINTDRIAQMIHGGTSAKIDETAKLAVNAIVEAFIKSDKNILYQGEEIGQISRKVDDSNEKKPTLTILSGIPGGGKSSYATQETTHNEKTVVITNDSLRGILSGVREADINQKIRHTNFLNQGQEVPLETFVTPKINEAKDALIEIFLEHGYNIIADAVHPKGSMRKAFDEKYREKADIQHVLVGPDNLRTGLQKATQREQRPENRKTIKKIGKRLNELMAEKDEKGNPKYKFDKVIANHYEKGGFEDITEKFYAKKK